MPLPIEDRYLSTADVEMRLVNSIVNYKGTYYWCQIGDPNDHAALKVRLYELTDTKFRKGITVSANDAELDPTSPELGWLFEDDLSQTALYMSRAPFRKQKQGLGPDNLLYYSANPDFNRPAGNKTDPSFCLCRGMHDLLHRQRIPFETAWKAAQKKDLHYNGAPITKHMAIIRQPDNTFVLYRHLTILGTVTAAGVSLYPEWSDSLTVMSLMNNGIPIVS